MFPNRFRQIELDIEEDQGRHVPDTTSVIGMPNTNDAALDAFIAAKTEIDALLVRLAGLCARN